MLYAEFWRKPITICTKNRMIGYLLNCITEKTVNYQNCFITYFYMYNEYNAGTVQHKWIHCIREILISVGCIDFFNKVNFENAKSLKA